MSNDALADWLARYQNPAAPDGPRRREYLRETLAAGDVWEDGAIQSADGGPRLLYGTVWVEGEQSWRAAYYGWAIVDDGFGPTWTNDARGVRLYLIERNAERPTYA